MKSIYLLIVLLPLFGAAFSGFFCRVLSKESVHWATCSTVGLSFLLSIFVLVQHSTGLAPFNENIYTWMSTGTSASSLSVGVGFLVDNLTAMMMCVVTFVSLMVHIYSIGYMKDDPSYNRFFSYISLFTFSMLMLVMANNFMQLFFGWEAVGLVSYLLIGFWFKKPSATYANMKAFLVNRVGDFGFIIGIACVLYMYGSLNYADVFQSAATAPEIATQSFRFLGTDWSIITFACIFLFIGAMGKSAQVPLHVWLPDSMEGPTPISALIHAATMVTAGIFMVARMSPLFELSSTALSFIMIIGAITALFMGFLGIIQNDIKRVVAYSTISQLGYMTVALGASAYSVAVFHLMTHAFFKALLFLGAGSVIIAMHHEQDMRYMGGLRKYMKVTYWTALLGSLSLIGTPFFSGFYSKESIIVAVEHSELVGSGFAYTCLLLGVFITALYSFRLFFMVFHGKPRFKVVAHPGTTDAEHHDEHGVQGELHEAPKESTWVVTLPLILLAIPSVVIGALFINPMLFGDFFTHPIKVNSMLHPSMSGLAESFHGWWNMGIHSLMTLPFWLALAGVVTAWFIYLVRPTIATCVESKMRSVGVLKVLENKYYLDDFNQKVMANGAVKIGINLWKYIDDKLIDQTLVYGTANLFVKIGAKVRKLQSGYLYHYAFAMIIGLLGLLTWILVISISN